MQVITCQMLESELGMGITPMEDVPAVGGFPGNVSFSTSGLPSGERA
jgi:hypothetical protein